MKNFMIAALLVSAGMCLGAVAEARLQFKTAGFSIQPLETQPGRFVYQPLIMLLPPSNGFASNVNIQVQPYPGTIDEYVAISKKQFVAAKFDLIREDRVGKESVLLEYAGELKGRKMHWYAKAMSNGKAVYLATATTTETQWPKTADRLKECVHSFEIEKSK